MKLKQTTERDCCQERDLKAVEGCRMINFSIPTLMFCVHCGHRHEYDSFMDEAGSRDYRYVKMKEQP